MLHISAGFPCGSLFSISGATYPGVPQAASRLSSLGLTRAANPKSANLIDESSVLEDNNKFSGFKSLCTMCLS